MLQLRLVSYVGALCVGFLGLNMCGGGTAVEMAPDAGDDVSFDAVFDAVNDLPASPLDLYEDETGLELPEVAEVAEVDSIWVPGPGEFGYPCGKDEECVSGFCIQTLDGMRCTMACDDECPPGFECAAHGLGPDVTFVCQPPTVQLCRPCRTNADCWLDGLDGAQKCVVYGASGSFCGASCDAAECPAGYGCEETQDTSGDGVKQCVLLEGECDCQQWYIDVAASTDCFVTNEFGLCSGERVCKAEGLTGCSAQTPEEELCNGLDDDCDGQIDEDSDGSECLLVNGFGACPGVETCSNGKLVCGGEEAHIEKCDGDDNDCDGFTDEGFPDTDGDGLADCLENDKDGDGTADGKDNCPDLSNPDQADTDFDSLGDLCDLDDDNDLSPDIEDCAPKNAGVHPGAEEICDGQDNDCDYTVDEGFADSDFDGFKDCVDEDDDNDGTGDGLDCQPLDPATHPGAAEVCDGADNDCDGPVDEGFADTDGDEMADCVDGDIDGDEVDNDGDNCPNVPNADQIDSDGDGHGDACDGDVDGDGVPDATDNCPEVKNALQQDLDGDELGDACDGDADGDTLDNEADNCPVVANLDQADADGDGIGDACEDDADGDGTPDAKDCAPLEAAVHPGAEENCDGVDNDCDTLIDEGFVDSDADGLKDCVDEDDDNDGTLDELDCAPQNVAVHPGVKEVCNGQDDNCDGETDEGLGTQSCGKGACAHVVDKCLAGELQICDPYEGAAFESCDGLDNDCDGLTDEDSGSATCGKGNCFHTVPNCANGEPVACDPLEGAAEEVCDGEDNDCDGKTDEEQPKLACGTGQCFHTVPSCSGGVEQVCDAFQGATKEVCDGQDNDCDGATDEDLGQTTCGLGGCEHTVDNCVGGVSQLCNPLVGAAEEVCDAVDNNCNGLIDDGLGVASCGQGQCLHAVVSCIDGQPQECDPLDGAEAEVCDGEDNDCNGLVDEGLAELTCGLGECAHSAPACVEGEAQECDPLEGAVDESCDGLDDDCDGTVDEDFLDTNDDEEADCIDDDDDGDGDPDETDCAPLDPTVHNAASEICFNDVDDDCDGEVDTGDGCVLESCKALHAAYAELASGTYTIDPDGEGPVASFKVYCEMSYDGGGWTLVLKNVTNNSDFYYAATYWTQANTLNPDDFALGGTVNSKYAAFNSLPFSDILVDMNSVKRKHTVAAPAASVLSLTKGGGTLTSPDIQGKSYKPKSYWELTADGHESIPCKNFGFNYDNYGDGGLARLGFQLSQEFPCGHPGTSEGVGLWERNQNDHLGSGRLQWSGETNYFAKAFVYIR